MDKLKDTISVTVDKSHIVSIGERLYSESIELIRELVANSYDADATRVDIIIKKDEIVICDDGEGMDRKGLEQFFNIGSPFKRINRKSPKFNRERIGEFGIGKFAVLSCASYFEVISRKGDFCARVIFDKERWDESYDWELPLEILSTQHRSYDGTTIILRKLKKTFEISRVEERLRETLPLRSENFSVYLNQKMITPRISLGHKIPFLESTNFGIVYGEIVIVSSALADIRKAGIEIRVKGVLVKREMFGLDALVKDISRIQGEVNADFLVLTTDRTDIIKDNEQYKEFMNVMNKVIVRVKDVIKDFFEFKESRRAKRVLDEVLDKIKKVLILNPNICPEGLLPLGEDLENSIGGQLATVSNKAKSSEDIKDSGREKKEKGKIRKKYPQVRRLSTTAVVRRMRLGEKGISCAIDHFGEDGPESFSEGNMVYMNRDHLLFKKASQDKEMFTFYLVRILSQEIALMKTKSAKEAFLIQSKLIKDAYQLK
ncbi:MAG: ATP-binding protein [Candidatus Omnitrophica bacterium]|nr:ATP-binding protein [Candidatus Omnitrophota bacterium]